jgi:hypothetical protein
VEAESTPQQVQENIEKVETADLVVGVLGELDQGGLVAIYDAFRTLPDLRASPYWETIKRSIWLRQIQKQSKKAALPIWFLGRYRGSTRRVCQWAT